MGNRYGDETTPLEDGNFLPRGLAYSVPKSNQPSRQSMVSSLVFRTRTPKEAGATAPPPQYKSNISLVPSFPRNSNPLFFAFSIPRPYAVGASIGTSGGGNLGGGRLGLQTLWTFSGRGGVAVQIPVPLSFLILLVLFAYADSWIWHAWWHRGWDAQLRLISYHGWLWKKKRKVIPSWRRECPYVK